MDGLHFLSAEKVKQLKYLPVSFGDITSSVSSSSARLNIRLDKSGRNASAIIYYGEKDYYCFAPRELHSTEKKLSVLGANKVWKYSKKINRVSNGVNTVQLDNLKPKTKYFFRILITNDEGKMWTFETHHFTTK